MVVLLIIFGVVALVNLGVRGRLKLIMDEGGWRSVTAAGEAAQPARNRRNRPITSPR